MRPIFGDEGAVARPKSSAHEFILVGVKRCTWCGRSTPALVGERIAHISFCPFNLERIST